MKDKDKDKVQVTDHHWLNYEDYKFEQEFKKEKMKEIFPLMGKTNKEIEKEVRDTNKDLAEGVYEFNGVFTGREGRIQIEIEMQKHVRDLLNK